jgi:hypothetical protein
MSDFIEAVFGIALVVVLIVVISLLFAFPAMWLWNWALVPVVSILSPVQSVWQMWGIMVLTALLFKSSGSGGK